MYYKIVGANIDRYKIGDILIPKEDKPITVFNVMPNMNNYPESFRLFQCKIKKSKYTIDNEKLKHLSLADEVMLIHEIHRV